MSRWYCPECRRNPASKPFGCSTIDKRFMLPICSNSAFFKGFKRGLIFSAALVLLTVIAPIIAATLGLVIHSLSVSKELTND